MNSKRPDPRVTFAFAIVVSIYGVIFRRAMPMAALLVVTIACAGALGVRFARLAKRLKWLLQAAVMVALMQSVFAPSGRVLLSVANIPLFTAGGLDKGLTVLFRLAAFITVSAMIASYRPRALIQGMVQLKLPYTIAYMVSIGVRFVPQVGQDFKDSMTALQLRGVVIEELKLRKRLRLYSYLLLPMLAQSLQNARELATSMEMRAFRAMKERTSWYTLAFSKRDFALLAAVTFFAMTFGAYAAGLVFH